MSHRKDSFWPLEGSWSAKLLNFKSFGGWSERELAIRR